MENVENFPAGDHRERWRGGLAFPLIAHCQVPGYPWGGSEHCGDYAVGIAKGPIDPGRGKNGRLGLYDHRWGEVLSAQSPPLPGAFPGDIGLNLSRSFSLPGVGPFSLLGDIHGMYGVDYLSSGEPGTWAFPTFPGVLLPACHCPGSQRMAGDKTGFAGETSHRQYEICPPAWGKRSPWIQ